jgi:hypothetical protein
MNLQFVFRFAWAVCGAAAGLWNPIGIAFYKGFSRYVSFGFWMRVDYFINLLKMEAWG